ncbi:hypothetical protein GCM10028794_19070 [Silanimonas algicola]
MSPGKKNATGATVAQHMANLRGLYGQPKATGSRPERKGGRDNPVAPTDWRDRLPDPAAYYACHLSKVTRPNADGWAQARCPFHEDKVASLSVHLTSPRGGWKCFAGCGSGDLVSFHMRLRGLPFPQARSELLKGA